MAAESARGVAGGIARQAGWFLAGALVTCGGFSLFLAGVRGVACLDALWQVFAGILLGALFLVPVGVVLGCSTRLVRAPRQRRGMYLRKPVSDEGGLWLHQPSA